MDAGQKLYNIGLGLNLEFNNRAVYGFIKNVFVIGSYDGGHEGRNQYISFKFSFPTLPDIDDINKIISFREQNDSIVITPPMKDNENFHIKADFISLFIPPSVAEIVKTVSSIANYMAEKYPDLSPACSIRSCRSTEKLNIYNKDSIPILMCSECAAREKQHLLAQIEAERNKPNNYLQGITNAVLRSMIPVILVFILLKLIEFNDDLELLPGSAGFFFYYFAFKGYTSAGGKDSNTAYMIISATSVFCTAAGMLLGFMVYDMVESGGCYVKDSFNYVVSSSTFHANLIGALIVCFICSMIMFMINASYQQNLEYSASRFDSV